MKRIAILLILAALALPGCTTDQTVQAQQTHAALVAARGQLYDRITAARAAISTLPADDPVRKLAEKNLPAFQRSLAYMDLALAFAAPTTQPAN